MTTKQRYTVAEVIEAIGKGHTPSVAARFLKCHADTVRNYADRYPTVKRALQAERKEIVELAEVGLRAAVIRCEPWAITFALKTLGKEEGYCERTEHTGKDGGAIETKVTHIGEMSDDELAHIAARGSVGTPEA